MINMALKSKEEKTNEQISFDDLEFEAVYEAELTTISGKEQTDVSEFEPYEQTVTFYRLKKDETTRQDC